MPKIIYDGSPQSVEKIMDITGTRGVMNTDSGRVYLPFNEFLDLKGTFKPELWFDETHWWCQGKAWQKHKRNEDKND